MGTWRDRDPAAFGAMVDGWTRIIRTAAAGWVQRDELEDVVQEVLLRVWQKADTFDPARGGCSASWVWTITRHLLYDRAGKHRVATTPLAPHHEPALPMVADDDPGEALTRMFGRYPPQPMVLWARGVPYVGIACALDRSVAAIKSSIHRQRGRGDDGQ
jgi:DNA-directed RNA polymerase specialized sigma24 family protein